MSSNVCAHSFLLYHTVCDTFHNLSFMNSYVYTCIYVYPVINVVLLSVWGQLLSLHFSRENVLIIKTSTHSSSTWRLIQLQNVIQIQYKHLEDISKNIYTECPRRNVPDFGRVFLMLKYTDITQNTYVQSWTVKEIMAREKCGLLAGPRTVPVSWQSYPCQSLSAVSYDSSSAHARLIPECAVSLIMSPLGSHLSCIVLGTLRTTMTWVRVFL